jgi:hypothetical protein
MRGRSRRVARIPDFACASSGLRSCAARSRHFLFTMSNSAVFFAPAARFCPRVFLPSSSPPSPKPRRICLPLPLPLRARPQRGAGGAPGGGILIRRALVKARTTFARRGRPGQTGTGLSALHPGDFGPGLPNLPGTVYEPRPGRHSPLRLQDRLRRRPSMSEDDGNVATTLIVVNTKIRYVITKS